MNANESPESPERSSPPVSPRACVVCERPAKFKHFGVICCEACSVFFKRTLASPGNNFCRCAKRYVSKSKGRNLLCKFCRMRRCIETGMDVPGFTIVADMDHLNPLQASSDSPFQSLVSRRYAFFVNRIKKMVEMQLPKEATKGTFAGLQMFYAEELGLLRNFLACSDDLQGFLALEADLADLTQHFFVIWTTFETMLTTARNAGYARNQLVCLDGTTVDISVEGLMYFTSDNADVHDKEGPAKACIEKFVEVLAFTENLRRADLDDTEVAAFYQLVFAFYESNMFGSRYQVSQYMNRVFSNLRQYYEQTSADFATRMGTLTTLVGGFHHVRQLYHEIALIFDLYSRQIQCCSDESHLDCRRRHRLFLRGDEFASRLPLDRKMSH
ncbi:CRE-NHR-53 protein [Aphelenchoides avenae]|nr:CRE-NHR-53 protein [Aphelenchus avenae]